MPHSQESPDGHPLPSTPASTGGTDPSLSDTKNPPPHLAALCWSYSVLGAVLAGCLPWGGAEERGERWGQGDRWGRWWGLVLRHVLPYPCQVHVGQPEVLLDGLEPGRDYEISVQSLRGPEASEVRSINARTSEYPSQATCSHSRCSALFF